MATLVEGFAVVADERNQLLAVFADLDAAMTWGLERVGPNRFRIRHISLMSCESDEARAGCAAAGGN